MRSNILIARLARLVETAGTSGNGAREAEMYVEAVKAVNARLEAVVAAADAKVISDAIRIISEDPPLLEEVSTLDFFQLADWRGLCSLNGWTVPPEIDRNLVERVVEIAERKDAIAPFLSMYKKAVRTNNVRLAVKSLRRLVNLDSSQNWKSNLKQSETQLQNLLVDEFAKAQSAGSTEDCERLEQELLDGIWQDPLGGKGVDGVRAFRAKREAARREATGRENLEILRKCRDGEWNRKLAFAMVQAIDGLAEKGWTIPEADKSLVEECRARCAKEFEQEEMEARWKELNERLHAAIQREDITEIRDVLSAPEFLDRNPDNNMLADAQAVIEHAEAARRRKMRQIVTAAVLIVVAVVSLSGWWLSQQMFTNRCEDEAVTLAFLDSQSAAKPASTIDALSKRLAELKANDPEVYEYPKVIQYEARLKTLVAEQAARTNRIQSLLAELETLMRKDWADVAEQSAVTNRILTIETSLAKEDQDYTSRLLEIKDSWMTHQERVEQSRITQAQSLLKTLLSHLNTVSSRLEQELAGEALLKEESNCRASLKEWRELHSQYAVDKIAELDEAEKKLNEAVDAQTSYKSALDDLVKATDAKTVLAARERLVQDFGNYPETKRLGALGVSATEVQQVLDGQHPELEAFAASLKSGLTDEEFASFLEEGVKPIAETPEWYSLFGVREKAGNTASYFAISKGKPEVNKPSYEKKTTVAKTGRGLLSLLPNQRTMVNEIKGNGSVQCDQLPLSGEMKDVVEIANRGSLTAAQFESELLKLIEGHVTAAHKADYLKTEEQFLRGDRPLQGWFSPYARVKSVAIYLRWLREDLKLMPKAVAGEKWIREAERLSQIVAVDGVDEELTWACLWDERIKKRNRDCARLLAEAPRDWTVRYRKAKGTQFDYRTILSWKVQFAGKIKFDPLDPDFAKNPDAIVVDAPTVSNKHPLYVLRQVGGRLRLVRAFEEGKISPWRKCAAVAKSGQDYMPGEPLYHVFAKGNFIDVQEELSVLSKRMNQPVQTLLASIPIYGSTEN